MSKAVIASYYLPQFIKNFIDKNSKKLKLSKGKFLSFLIEDYNKTKKENQTLKSYFAMATDKDFLKEQILEAEEDLQIEIKYNNFYDED